MSDVYHGSSKDVITRKVGGGSEVDLLFTDRFSIADVGSLPFEIEEMGYLRCAIAIKMFEVLDAAGIPHHMRSADLANQTITVEPFNIYELNRRFDDARGRIVPLEIIDRGDVTEALFERAKSCSELKAKMLRNTNAYYRGAFFTPLLIECTTKFESKDRRLLDAEAMQIATLDGASYRELCRFVARAAKVMSVFYQNHGYFRRNGKSEVAIMHGSPNFVMADSHSPDEALIIGDDGLHYDKELLRQEYYRMFPKWREGLVAAQEKYPERYVDSEDKWPAYPEEPLSESFIADFRARYHKLAKDIGAI